MIAVDLDGPEAIEHWGDHYAAHAPRTWITHSGGDGKHLWFSILTDGERIASGRLWGEWDPTGGPSSTGDWCRRKNIELIGDGKLLMTPPSVHPVTGRTYRFLGGNSPREIYRPALAPAWLLKMPILRPPMRIVDEAPLATQPRMPLACPSGHSYDRRDVLASIRDKTALVRSWGLRLAGDRVTASGSIPAHRIGSIDRHPSALFNPTSGCYWDHTLDRAVGLFDLGVMLGIYRDWREAVADLGDRYAVRVGSSA